jgi:hypothetical protein
VYYSALSSILFFFIFMDVIQLPIILTKQLWGNWIASRPWVKMWGEKDLFTVSGLLVSRLLTVPKSETDPVSESSSW